MTTGRFAPSPTGDLHLGNLRTALLAWLWARRSGGSFIVRMEDLDRVTSSRTHEESQLRDLAAIGLDWDGDVVRQSDRFGLYDEVLADLVSRGLTFECFCTRREIAEAASAPNGPNTDGRYPGTCRHLSAAELDQRRASGRPAALRLRSEHQIVSFVDEVHGPLSAAVDDVVLRRNDGVPAYNLAVVVDDVHQGVDHIVRADDLLDTVPAQHVLRSWLAKPPPVWAHVPLVLSERGTRLAKRDGAVTLADRIAGGDTPAHVVAVLLRSIGIPLDASEANGSVPEIIELARERFDPTAVPTTPLVLSDALLEQRLI